MIGKIYRIQAYVTWAFFAVLALFVFFGSYEQSAVLNEAGVLASVLWTALARWLLPVGTVLAVFARKEGYSPNSLLRHQLVSFGVKLMATVPLMGLYVWVTGGV